MSRESKRPALVLDEKALSELRETARSRMEPASRVMRSKILLMFHERRRVTDIAKELRTNRPLVDRCINKALAGGALEALNDLPRPGRKATITAEAKIWVLSVACERPANLGYAAETWTYSQMIKHLRAHCQEAGHACLAKIGKGRLHEILAKGSVQPHRISYYCEKRDPEFDAKMADVLCVYKEVEAMNADPQADGKKVTISYDEKPGIQAICNLAAQLQPVPGKYPTIGRDAQYKRLGTVSLLAGIDLHNGMVFPLVRERHRSREFVELLTLLDAQYPPDWRIRLVLDNHSAHTSKETQAFLLTRPGRYELVFTPKHGSWLNLVEMFFSKIARSFLRHIRVESKQELVDRIYKGIAEINQDPVVFRWRYKMSDFQATI
jgi:transposase